MVADKVGPTPGPWSIHEGGAGYGHIRDGNYRSLASYGDASIDRAESKANARLIAEAGTVHHETGLSPRQLAEHRAELLAALTMVRDADDDCHRDGLPTIPPIARAAIDSALAKAEVVA